MKRFLPFSLSFIAFVLLLFDLEGVATVFKTSRRLSGFSPDSRYYIYLESSRNSVTDVPTAQVQIVDVATNSCVKNGCLKTDYDHSSSNLSPQAAEDDLLKKTSQLRRDLRLNQLKVGIQLPIISRSTHLGSGPPPAPLSGRGKKPTSPGAREQTARESLPPIPLSPLPPPTTNSPAWGQSGVDPTKPDKTEIVESRLNNKPLQLRLEQKYIPSTFSRRGFGDVERSSMRLVINYDYRKLSLGDLDNYREAVQEYSIREVRLSPDGRNLVALIDMTQPTYEGVLLTTFVQSFPLPPATPNQGISKP
jgi:hypothetical protein